MQRLSGVYQSEGDFFSASRVMSSQYPNYRVDGPNAVVDEIVVPGWYLEFMKAA
jgi:hypothetical protein